MMKKNYLLLLLVTICLNIKAQSTTAKVANIEVSNSKVVKLGHSEEIRTLKKKEKTSQLKRIKNRRFKKVPDNFKGRRGESKSIYKNLEHQGPDPIRQTETSQSGKKVEPLLNFNGLSSNFGSPNDPSGDVSDEFYVQMINATVVGVYDLLGNLIDEFAANTLWTEFNQTSAGDPIVLYDENVDRWILTEFADPANVLIAISDDGDPLGGYSAYNFSTPTFPDYPKYAISPDFLTFTSNEEGAGELHQYFIDLNAMYNGDEVVNMQRITLPGNTNTEAGFYVTTPVDWNGMRLPFDNRPIVLRINDSSWEGGPAEDQIEIYAFDINFDNEDSTQVIQTSVVTTPFDSYPCSESGFGFACVPQSGGSGLDAVPEVIMNIPHLRNFGTHESMVFCFVTDVTDGDNLSGIRWMEMRRNSADDDWQLYQEGTFAPDDMKDRFMPSIAMDSKGNIGLAYNISSSEDFVGARYTGRFATDPLGEMTIEETVIIAGRAAIESGERFGDYSQMSVSPFGDNTFWWTSEYAGSGPAVTETRIVAFQLMKDTFDLALRAITNPVTSATLTESEQLTASVINSGLTPLADFKVELLVDNIVAETLIVTDTLQPDSIASFTFLSLLDLSEINRYELGAVVTSEIDENRLNDTLRVSVRQLHQLEGAISAEIEQGSCLPVTNATIEITNNGANPIDSARIAVEINGNIQDTIFYKGSISFEQSDLIKYGITQFDEGDNLVKFQIISLNGAQSDGIIENNFAEASATKLAEDKFITLEFTTDEYPEESMWSLFTQNTGELISSGSFSAISTTVEQRICVEPDSCFTLVISDAYGDGICCDFGQGNFNVYDNQGTLLVSNDGQFGSEAVEEFCGKGFECSLSIEVMSTNASAIDSADGIIMIDVSGGVEPLMFSIDDGESFQDSAVFTNVRPGDYEVIVTDESGLCEVRDSINVGFTSAVQDLEGNPVEVNISPNPTRDVFKLSVKDLEVYDPQLSVEILDLSGRIIQQRKIGNYSGEFVATFSLMDYPAGTYMVRIRHQKFHFLEKLVKLKD